MEWSMDRYLHQNLHFIINIFPSLSFLMLHISSVGKHLHFDGFLGRSWCSILWLHVVEQNRIILIIITGRHQPDYVIQLSVQNNTDDRNDYV